ncbi:ubiquinol oxidase subunit II [Govanella unica]|uniref:Ubiquinol oxidase subunit 2 n=1 Tax=Govanella unica TaxID=2975056 RepID=A0A9X3Z6R2_9PROT|nr:ubiquinol oxidase subunit II [Govania unica]
MASSVLLLGGCERGGLIDPQGPIGHNELKLMINSVEIMLVIIIPVIIMTLWFAWWYRASNTKARYLPEWAYSGRVEFVVWSIPILTIMFLGGIAWVSSHDLDPMTPLPSHEEPLDVRVVALDWKWLFIYPDQGVASVNELVIPEGVPVHFSLTASNVMNSFFVPQLGSMIYAMPGMRTQLYLQADKPGEYHGLSTNFSGDGFAGMKFKVHSVSYEQFTDWVDKARGTGRALDAAEYQLLVQQSEEVKPFTYHSVSPDLFDDIVTKKLAPGPGPKWQPGALGARPAEK